MKHKSTKTSGIRMLTNYIKYAGFDMEKTQVIRGRGVWTGNSVPMLAIVTHDSKMKVIELAGGWQGLQSDEILAKVIHAYHLQFGVTYDSICDELGIDPEPMRHHWHSEQNNPYA